MPKAVELCQLVACAIDHTTYNIPLIRDGSRWRNIQNSHLVSNPYCVNGHDRFEEAIFRMKRIMESCGWDTELTGTRWWTPKVGQPDGCDKL
jgi:hypothetical protein